MAERKAVIKNADMAEDMQQDAVDCASQALEKYNIEKVRTINSIRHTIMSLTEKYSHKFYNLRRILLPTSKRNLTRNIILHGTALLEETSDLMLRTRRSILYTSILDKLQFCYLSRASCGNISDLNLFGNSAVSCTFFDAVNFPPPIVRDLYGREENLAIYIFLFLNN